MFAYLYFIFELFAFICCAYAYKNLDSNFKIFLPFLAFVVVYEFFNMFFLNLLLWHHSNGWCNNLEGIVELLVYGYFLDSLHKGKTYKKTVRIVIAIGMAINIIDVFFIHGFWTLATTAIVSQNILLSVLVCVYFYHLFNNTHDYPDLLRYPPFLATLGLLLYSLSGLFFYIPFDYLLVKNNQEFFINAHFIIQISSGFIYSLLGIAFLSFPNTKKEP